MPAATMSYLDWSAIVARAQEAYRLRRWAGFMAEIGDRESSRRMRARARDAERAVLAIARGCGVTA